VNFDTEKTDTPGRYRSYFCCPLLGYWLCCDERSHKNHTQKFTPSAHTSIILSLESVFGALAGIIMLGEKFTLLMFVGSVLILISVIISNIPEKKDATNSHL
jgi:hypothetical protein